MVERIFTKRLVVALTPKQHKELKRQARELDRPVAIHVRELLFRPEVKGKQVQAEEKE